MKRKKADTKSDKEAVVDRHESLALMEPLVLSSDCRARPELIDLALELTGKSAALERSLPSDVRNSLVRLVRTMNCYYSNLIEGHSTHPVDIERAVEGNFDSDQRKRDLQLEARAHVQVQAWIDSGALDTATTTAALLEIHRRFCDALPPDLLSVEDPQTGERVAVAAGEIRRRDVRVGKHIAISPGAVPRFLDRYEQVYSQLGRTETIIGAAAAHHRLLWIHPFVDGNGRVARLMSYAQLRKALDSGGIWSIARGLARTVEDYKRHLMACDTERWNDYDGRGHLSEQALSEFTAYFLQTCIDQVDFMDRLIEPTKLQERMLAWCEEESRHNRLLPNAKVVLQAVAYRGELPRGEVPDLLGLGERQARRVVSGLLEKGALVASSDRAPLRLCFSAALAPRWMPGLFPDKPSQ